MTTTGFYKQKERLSPLFHWNFPRQNFFQSLILRSAWFLVTPLPKPRRENREWSRGGQVTYNRAQRYSYSSGSFMSSGSTENVAMTYFG